MSSLDLYVIAVLCKKLQNYCQNLIMHEKQESYLISEKTQHEVIDQEHVLKLEHSGIVQCGIATCRESFNVYRKSPKQHMLLFTIRGKGWLNSQGHRYLLEPGSLMVIPAGVENGFGIEEENWQLAWLFLSAQREWPNHLGEQIHYGFTPAADVMYTCIQTLLRAQILPDEIGQPVAQRAVEQIELLLATPGERQMPRAQIRLNRMFERVQKQLHKEWSVIAMAALVPCSVAHLHRLCLHYLGRSPTAHLTRLRMEYAARQLARSDWPIQQIGEMVGYPNAANFSTRFKAWSRVTPRAYRLSHCED